VRQLSLFPGIEHEPEPEPEPQASAPELLSWPNLPDALPGQLHLFSDRSVRLSRARAAITEARLDDARRELVDLKKRFPRDPFITREAAHITTLRRRFAAAMAAPPGTRAEALLAFARSLDGADEPFASLRRTALRRAADELRRAEGDAATLSGQPPGFYLLEAGALDEAKDSLTRTLSIGPSARALFLLADTTLLLGAPGAARRLYLEALLLDPFDPALGAVRDEAVRALPSTAQDDLELDDEPMAWSAPVGIVTFVLPMPVGLPRGALALAELAQAPTRAPSQRDALERARAFVQALAEAASPEGRSRAVDLRRTMKQLSPRLFAAYMDRVVRSKGG
jgi:tetratricopeptide (TPR) repeat protein